MSASEIVWKEPPPKDQRNRQGALAIWDTLREHPGEWCLYKQASTSAATVTHIRRGQYVGIEVGEFEAVSRKLPDRKFDIYVRYVGNGNGANP